MIDYRLYFFNAKGEIASAQSFQSETDIEATDRAKQVLDSKALELWSGARLVARLEPDKTTIKLRA